jgi:chemotaxis protein methyltransferase CheR
VSPASSDNEPRPPPSRELPSGDVPELTDRDFLRFRSWLFDHTAIELPDHKRALVSSRLIRRLQARKLGSFGDYLELLENKAEDAERRMARDLLTTNETSFFREPKHFAFLRSRVLPDRSPGRPFRVWSAASSSGEEPYTIAMELAEHLGLEVPWEVLGSDISSRVLEKAKAGTYSVERANLTDSYLRKYCLKGISDQQGLFRIKRPLRDRVRFMSIALHEPLPQIGRFDVVFLRNVLIYFSLQTRQLVISQVEQLLLPGGYLFVSHSENLQGIDHRLAVMQPSVYRKAVRESPPSGQRPAS